MKTILAGVALFLLLPTAAAAGEACVDGVAGNFACSHIDLVGQLTPADLGGPGEELNDIWGWVDSGGVEYALVGMQDGTAFVRITAGGVLVPLGRLPASDGRATVTKRSGHSRKFCHDELCSDKDSAWRDIKVFGDHAYIVSEAVAHGLQIFDLTQLAGAGEDAGKAWSEAGFYDDVGHAHNIFINEDTARAYVVGHDGGGVAGGLHVLDISTPTSPTLLAELNGDGYTHDVQCVVYNGPDGDYLGRELCFASNEDTLTVWDVEDVDTLGEDGAAIVSRTTYSESGYTHQGWLSPDHRYFYLNDELDEMHTGSRTHLRVFRVTDVDAPTLVAEYFAPTLSIDHNNYAYGRWLYQSNYGAGLRILDVSDPRHPVEAAYFDTQPTDTPGFYGSWSNYTLPSGRVAISDIGSGLFVVAPTLDTATTSPDLLIELVLDDSEVDAGDSVSGEFTIASGAAADASDVLVTAHLPSGATFIDVVEPAGWTCAGQDDGRVVQCRAATFDADSEAAFGFTARGDVAGDIDTVAMVYAKEADASPAGNLASATFSVAGGTTAGGSGSSGGGGGAFGLLALLLAGLRGIRIRR